MPNNELMHEYNSIDVPDVPIAFVLSERFWDLKVLQLSIALTTLSLMFLIIPATLSAYLNA